MSGARQNPYCVLAQEDLDGRITATGITFSISDSIRQIAFYSGIGSNRTNTKVKWVILTYFTFVRLPVLSHNISGTVAFLLMIPCRELHDAKLFLQSGNFCVLVR